MSASSALFTEADVVHEYSRENAIDDRRLVDVTRTAREAGFTMPVAVTAEVYDRCIRWTEEDTRRRPNRIQDEDGRLWDVVWMAACKARLLGLDARKSATTQFQLIVVPRPGHGRRRLQTLKLTIDGGDNHEAVATILLPEQD